MKTKLNRMMRLSPTALVFSWIVSHSFAAADPLQNVLITGSSTLAPLVSELVTEFEKTHPTVKIDVETGGSSKGIADCVKGLNSVGMVSRELNASEKEITGIPVAKDGLAFVNRPESGVDSLSANQIKDIFLGKVTNWKELGGADLAIQAVSKAEGRAALEAFKEYFSVKSSDLKAKVIVGDEAQAVKTILSTPGSIGFVGIATLMQATKENPTGLRAIKVAGVTPTLETLRTNVYPYSRKLQLVQCRNLDKQTKEFVEYVTSPAGQKIVSKAGYVPL